MTQHSLRPTAAVRTALLLTRSLVAGITLCLAAVLAAAEPVAPPEHGEIVDGHYHFAEIGWSMPLPRHWEMLPQATSKRAQDAGNKAIEGALGQAVDTSGLRHLLALTRDRGHVFQSSIETVSADFAAQWPAGAEFVRAVMLQTYGSKGIKVEATPLRNEEIGGVTFSVFDLTIFKPDGSPMLYQRMYGTLFGEQDFGIALTYQNPAFRDEMLAAIRASTFQRPGR
ncbi:hypothetical protein [Hydrogenophaga sp. 5NK40-0174]|uniref:hypothetical protein n=1 Tax=Hydrogenophaga sp. 5NK40-0174 TaxID=3127649 RepID=UPI0031080CD3